jgi:hypothetical protein
MNKEYLDARECLKKYRRFLTRQQLKTLMGQVKAGDIDGAMNGLDKILTRMGV